MKTLAAQRDELEAELDALKGELAQLPEGSRQRADRAQAYLLVWGKLRRLEAMLEAARHPGPALS